MPDNIIRPEDLMSSEENPQIGNNASEAPTNVITPEDLGAEARLETAYLRQIKNQGISVDRADELFRLAGVWQADDSNQTREGILEQGQSGAEVWTNTFYGSSANFIAGFLDNFNYDIPDMADMINGKQKEYGNWLTDITKELRDASELFPIYEAGDDFGTARYWAKLGVNTSYSVGLVAGTIAEQAALATTTGGFGNAASLAGKAAKALRGAAVMGSIKGIQEGYQNGLETFENTKNKYLANGYTEEDAITYASEAASLGYKMEVLPLMALNTLQYATIGRYDPFTSRGFDAGFSGAFSSAVERALPRMTNKFAKKAIGYGVAGASEGVEEGYQTYVSKLATHKVMQKSEDNFLDFDPWDAEMRDSILAGAIMGGVFKASHDIRSKIEGRRNARGNGREQDQFIAEAAVRTRNDLEMLRAAQETNDKDKIMSALYRLERGNVFRALNLDYINQRGTLAFDQHLAQLNEVYDGVISNNQEIINKYGLKPEDIEYVRDNYQTAIADAVSIKEKLTKNLERLSSYETAALTTDAEFLVDKAVREQNKASQEMDQMRQDNPIYQSLSQRGREIADLQGELQAMNIFTSYSTMTTSQKNRFEEINRRLKELQEEEYEEKSQDQEHLSTFNNDEIISKHLYRLGQQRLQVDASERYKKYSSPEYARELEEKRKAESLRNAATREQLEQIRENEDLTQEEQEQINARIEDEVVRENENEIINQSKVTPNDTSRNQEEFVERRERAESARVIENLASELGESTEDPQPRVDVDDNGNVIHVVGEEIAFDPISFNEPNESQNARIKALVAEYVDDLTGELGGRPSFNMFIEDAIQQMGKKAVDNNWNILVRGWELNGYRKPEMSYNDVWRTFFRSRKDVFGDLVSIRESLSDTEQNVTREVLEERNEAEQAQVDATNKPSNTNEQGKISEFENNTNKVSDGNNKLSYKSILSRTEQYVNDQGEIITREVDTEDQLNTTSQVAHQKILDWRNVKPGTIMTVRIPTNYQEYRVSEWDENSVKMEYSPQFSEIYDGSLEDIASNPRALAKIPLVVVDQNGDEIAFIHDAEWYNRNNVSPTETMSREDIINEGRNNTMQIRRALIESPTREVQIEITERSTGVLTKLDRNQPMVPINEMNPQALIGIDTGSGQIIVNGGKDLESLGYTLVNKKAIEMSEKTRRRGRTYDLREISEGKYIALETTRPKLPQEVIDTIVWAVRIKQDYKNKQYLSLRNQIVEAYGLDLYESTDLNKYLKHFINTDLTQGVVDNKDTTSQITAKIGIFRNSLKRKDGTSFPVGTPYTHFVNNKLYVGRVNQKVTQGAETVYVGNENALNVLQEILPDINLNTGLEALSSNRKMFFITPEGKINHDKRNYQEYLKDHYKTNVKSYNVGTEENPFYATTVQPIINFNLAGQVQEERREVIEDFEKPEALVETIPAQEESLMEEPADLESRSTLLINSLSLYDTNTLTEEEKVKHEKFASSISTLPGLGRKAQNHIVDFLFHDINQQVDPVERKVLDKKAVAEDAKIRFYEIIDKTKNYHLQILEELKSFNTEGKYTTEIKELENLLSLYESVDNNYQALEDLAFERVFNETGLEEIIAGQEGQFAESIQENGKTTASYVLKRFLSGIRRKDVNGNDKAGFLGLPTFIPYNNLYSELESIMTHPSAVGSSFELMMLRLKERAKGNKHLEQVVDYLEKTDDKSLKNRFVYNFSMHSVGSRFILWGVDRKGDYNQKIVNANNREIGRVLVNNWKSNFLTSSLVSTLDGAYYINKEKAAELYKKFKVLAENPVGASTEDIQKWISNFGITLSNNTVEDLRNEERVVIDTRGNKKNIGFEDLFFESSSSSGIFGLLGNFLNVIQHKQNTYFEEAPSNNPYTNIGKVLDDLVRKEMKYVQMPTTNIFRDGDKNVSGILQPTHALDTADMLINDEAFRGQFLNKAYNGKSILIKLLQENPKFRELFKVHQVALTAMKEAGKRMSGMNASVTSMPEIDLMTSKAGFFFDSKQGVIDNAIPGLDTRVTSLWSPTMSDKSGMYEFTTIGLDLRKKDISFTRDDAGSINLSDNVLDFMYSQLVEPELDRIIQANTNKDSDIVGYDRASKMFVAMSGLNNLRNKDGIRVISELKKVTTNTKEGFEKSYKQAIKGYLNKYVQDKTQERYEKWSEVFLQTDPKTKKESIAFADSGYFDNLLQNNTHAEALKIGAMDYTVNYLIHNANMFMAFAGDPALYSANKINKFFVDGDVTKPKSEYGDNAYTLASKNIIGGNINKRLAIMSAPGRQIANSKDDSYIQVMIEDTAGPSQNIKYVTRLLDGKEITDEEIQKIYDGKKDELAFKFPNSKDFFSNATTDAQEYTTIKEHLDILFRQGSINEVMHRSLMNKVSQENYTFSDKEKKIVFQPIKPVYTGFVNDQINGAMRMVYVKSSSFPLIPQMTKGTDLDKLRIAMENLQSEKKKNVRVSYQTANKVGATNNPARIFNKYGKIKNEITSKELFDSALILNREGFRIQQDVPFKSGKRAEDVISYGTQVLKLLFGDGVTDIEGFQYNGNLYKGKDLMKIFNDTFVEYINDKKTTLLEEFSKDENGDWVNLEEGVAKIQKLLKDEAISRGYPIAEVQALKLTPVVENGKVVNFEFTMPIWMSPNSDRYESLLNAIVTNRLARIKLPGNSYVAGSEAGMTQQSDLEGVDQSRIIYTDKWQGELQASNEKQLTQVFLPSKFRDNEGNLIRFFNGDGSINETYVERDKDGKLKFKQGMIDERLFNLTSFRIPTSSHVSMSQVEIVGILPPENGDLLIVPKNLTTQKGLDFDIDKENTYQLWTRMNDEGKIEVLENIENPTKKEKAKLLENELVKIHSAVLSNLNDEMQKKINKALSMTFAEDQADLIQDIADLIQDIIGQKTASDFSIFDDTYQDDLLQLGSAGKLGIGVYSNYVVFHSMVQQLRDTAAEPITLQRETSEGFYEEFNLTIGKLTSDGTIGARNTLSHPGISNVRTITEVLAERQNTATDNAKAQIMGRVNVNELTINVDSLLTLLGFDKDILNDKTEVSIPYLFLSQPIIRDYVKEMRKTKSSLTPYDPKAKDKVVQMLMGKYSKAENINEEQLSRSLTGQTLYDNISGTIDNNIQNKVLEIFLDLDAFAIKMGQLQNRLNVTNGGLGRNFFETSEKYQYLNDFQDKMYSGYSIKNAEGLIGEFLNINSLTPDSIQESLDNGYVKFKDTLIKPTTPVGVMVVNTVHSGYNLWKDQFVTQTDLYKKVEAQILANTVGEDSSSASAVRIQEKVLRGFKQFLYTSNKLGIYEGYIKDERQRLFIDSDDKQSLASYLNNIVTSENSFRNMLLDNPLIATFEYDIKRNGQPSLIKHTSTNTESFYEEYLYEALSDLYLQNKPLPDFNGKPYTTKDLMQDLVRYTFIGEPVQEGIQFLKYIPIEYLEMIGATGKLQALNVNFMRDLQLGDVMGYDPNGISNFAEQFLLHNPNLLPKFEMENASNVKYGNNTVTSFTLNENKYKNEKEFTEASKRKYIAVYNRQEKKGLKKYQIYKLGSDGRTYEIISPLGVLGMSEYDMYRWNAQSAVYNNYQTSIPAQSRPSSREVNATDIFQLKEGNVQNILDNIAEYPFESRKHLNNLAKIFKQYIPEGLNVIVADLSQRPELGEKGKRANGAYLGNRSAIYINERLLSSDKVETAANVFIHELIHALTKDFVANNPDSAEATQLRTLMTEAEKVFTPERINEFKRKVSAGEPISFEEKSSTYGMTDIYEFMSVAFEPEFQNVLAEEEYLASNKTFKQKFFEIIDKILSRVLGDTYKKNGLNANILSTIFEIMEKQKQEADILNDLFRNTDEPLMDLMTEGYFEENAERRIFTVEMRDKLPNFKLC